MSKRKFRVVLIDGNSFHENTISFDQLIGKLSSVDEYFFAMQECIDSILDLKLNESMYFRPNRDDKNSKGIIMRIS